MKECVFCKIVKGEKSTEKVYEDNNFLAFLDMLPLNLGHTLVIPKKHYKNLFIMPDGLVKKYVSLVKKLGPKIKEAMNARWINIFIFGEEVKHAHIHIVPRFDNDNFRYPVQKKYVGDEETLTANKIRRVLK